MIKKLFVFEAVSLVISSAILGSLVGIFLAMIIGKYLYLILLTSYSNILIHWINS